VVAPPQMRQLVSQNQGRLPLIHLSDEPHRQQNRRALASAPQQRNRGALGIAHSRRPSNAELAGDFGRKPLQPLGCRQRVLQLSLETHDPRRGDHRAHRRAAEPGAKQRAPRAHPKQSKAFGKVVLLRARHPRPRDRSIRRPLAGGRLVFVPPAHQFAIRRQ
jgi:hypothetical protein